jgi:hypothetical protein
MDRSFITALAASLLLTLPAQNLAAPAPTELEREPAAGDDIERISVTGRRPEGLTLRDYMFNFVSDIGDPVSEEFGFARWRKDVCVSVHNLGDAAAAQYVADRVSEVALELGLQPGEPGCGPSIQIAFTTDGRAMATELVQSEPRLFRPYFGTGGTTQGSQALQEFSTSDAPVRWWQLTMVVNRAGLNAIELPGAIGGSDSAGPESQAQGNGDLLVSGSVSGLEGVPWIPGSNSRITNAVRNELWNSYLIVDVAKTQAAGVSWKQLADYLAMVALAQIDPDRAPSGYDSILNLFSAGNQADGLTEMDLSYLRALYDLDTMRVPDAQRGSLASRMARRMQEPDGR